MYKLSSNRGRQGGFVPVSSIRFFVYAGLVGVLLLTGMPHASAHSNANQTTLDKIEVTLELNKETLKALFKKIESQTDLKFVFFENQINTISNLTLSKATRTVRDVLEIMLSGTGLSYIQSDNTVYIRKGSNNSGKKNGGTSFVEKVPAPQVSAPQYFTVTGKVTDAMDAEPVPGASILIKGTTNGTTTNGDGQFTLTVDEGDYLVFSSIGYKTAEVPVRGRTLIEISLEADAATLQTVTVNAGYYKVNKIDNTGSIARVDADVIGKQPVTNPIAALAGRMPGVFIEQTTGIPGGDFKIQIRGRNSLRAEGNSPLYIVDGVPFSTEKASSGVNAGGLFDSGVSPLTGLNPSDIESIEILKDADATAIYGSRGSNGVVLITTKRGKAGKTKIDVNVYSGVGEARSVKMLNTQQYLALRREAFALDGASPTTDVNDQEHYAPDLLLWDTTRYTDWQKTFIGGTARTNSVQASVTGGSELTQFMLSAGYRSETPVFPGSFKYDKLSTHFSANHLSDNRRFSVNANFSGTIDNNHQVALDATNLSSYLPPDAPALYQEDGNLNWENSTWANPFSGLQRTYRGRIGTIVTNVVLAYELFPGLKIKTSGGYTSVLSKEFNVSPSTAYDPKNGYTSMTHSGVTDANGANQSWILEPQASWEREIGKGMLSVLLGGTFQDQQLERNSVGYSNFSSNALLHNLSAAEKRETKEYVKSLYRYTAVFGRLNYNYEGKYIINVTARRDGSSRFGPGKQFANFGAIGAAWIFSSESFIKDNFHFLSFGKLRGSYGITGNDQIGNYQYYDTYTTATGQGNQYQGIVGLIPTRLFNQDFAWETNRKLEGALELGFFNDRIFLTAAYFRNRSSNQLVNYTLPMTTGFTGILANLGATVQNTGMEAELTTINLEANGFNWTTSFNVTIPRNKLIAFPNIESSTYANRYIVGESIYIQQLYESRGVDPQTGIYTFIDFNGDEQINAQGDSKKPVFVGQDLYGGLNNSFSWRGWKLDVFFQFVNQTGYSYWASSGLLGSAINHPALILNEKIWHQPGDQATIQRPTTKSIFNQSDPIVAAFYAYSRSDASVTDASFIRLKNVSLSYQFPADWAGGKVGWRFYLQGQNLFLISNYKWFDPETQQTRMPPLRMLTAGIQVTL